MLISRTGSGGRCVCFELLRTSHTGRRGAPSMKQRQHIFTSAYQGPTLWLLPFVRMLLTIVQDTTAFAPQHALLCANVRRARDRLSSTQTTSGRSCASLTLLLRPVHHHHVSTPVESDLGAGIPRYLDGPNHGDGVDIAWIWASRRMATHTWACNGVYDGFYVRGGDLQLCTWMISSGASSRRSELASWETVRMLQEWIFFCALEVVVALDMNVFTLLGFMLIFHHSVYEPWKHEARITSISNKSGSVLLPKDPNSPILLRAMLPFSLIPDITLLQSKREFSIYSV